MKGENALAERILRAFKPTRSANAVSDVTAGLLASGAAQEMIKNITGYRQLNSTPFMDIKRQAGLSCSRKATPKCLLNPMHLWSDKQAPLESTREIENRIVQVSHDSL